MSGLVLILEKPPVQILWVDMGKQILQIIFFYTIVTNTFILCDESTFVCIHVHVINSEVLKEAEDCAPIEKFGVDLRLEHAFISPVAHF